MHGAFGMLGKGFDSLIPDMERVIVTIDDAEFVLNSLTAMYELLKDGLTATKRKPYVETIDRLKKTIQRSKEYNEGTYFQEELEELDNDY